MNFLAQGDFNFPFTYTFYWLKHFYMWSFQSGVPNPDGFIRLPARALNFLVFALFGNVGASYFYLFSTLLVAFISFFLFVKFLLKIKNIHIAWVSALVFAVNPITLGNLSKVGLVLAASLVPLCLLLIKLCFEKKRIWYLLGLIVLINISFIHPYTFTVNFIVCALYFSYLAIQNRQFVFGNLLRIGMVIIVGLLANAYFILPLASMGTVSKDVISDNVIPIAADYTALVGISNTGNLFTGLAQAKDVFKDFEFFNSTYAPIYYASVFSLYLLIFGLFIKYKSKFSLADKRRFLFFLAGFLVLILLAATTVFGVDKLIRFLISAPGGWAFRSPLKWQLYLPGMIAGMLAITLSYASPKVIARRLVPLVVIIVVAINGFQIADVYNKLLVPRQVTNFAALQDMQFKSQTMLFINNYSCVDYMRANPRIVTELNQVLISKDLQVKKVFEESLDRVGVGEYDFVMTCEESLTSRRSLMSKYEFKQNQSFLQDNFKLYANQAKTQPIFLANQVYNIDSFDNMADKYAFMSTYGMQPLFAANSNTTNGSLKDVFESITPANFKNGRVEVELSTGSQTEQLLYAQNPKTYYSLEGNILRLASFDAGGMEQVGDKPIKLQPNQKYIAQYLSPIEFSNSVRNPSLEQGLWRDKVDDCYAYDQSPEIGMNLAEKHVVSGKKALQLSSAKHIACTNPDIMPVLAGEHYLVNFKFRSADGPNAGYHVVFDDERHTRISGRLEQSGNGWHSFSKEVTVPFGAKNMKLVLYAYPEGYDGIKTNYVQYDDVSVVRVPPLQDEFYVVGQDGQGASGAKINYKLANPSLKEVNISDIRQPVYVVVTDSYNQLWRAEASGKRLDIPQAKLNNAMSVWLVDPSKLCATDGNVCTKNQSDGYDIKFDIEFTPQNSFYKGALISLGTVAACAIYAIVVIIRRRKTKVK